MSIPVEYVRSSMHGTFKMCEMKYFLGYILGFDEKSNKKADMGSMFHKVMEILAKIKLAQQQNKRKIDDEIVGKYSTNLQKLNLDDIIDQVFNHYAKANAHHVWEEADHKTVIKWVEKALKFNNGAFDPLNQDIVQPEQHFNIQLEEDWASELKLKGTIDLLTKVNDTTYEIIDYKTGKRINWGTGEEKTFEKLQNDFQLRFYHLAASMLYPEIEDILITIYFVNDGGPFTISFTKDDLPETKNQIRKLYEEIKFLSRPKIRKRFHCRFCSFSKTTFEGTAVLPIINQGQTRCNFTEPGSAMSMCDQTNYIFNFRDIETIMENMTKEGHSLGHYQAPGDTK